MLSIPLKTYNNLINLPEYVRNFKKSQLNFVMIPADLTKKTGHLMSHIIVQIYEIQTADEAEKMIEAGVDHIGGVILSKSEWQNTDLRAAVETTRRSGAKSSLIPLFSDPETIFNVIEWYRPDIIHLCESLSGPDGILPLCQELVHTQTEIRNRFPEVKIMRSIPIATSENVSRVPTLELASLFEPVSDFFLTDTLLFDDKGNDDDQPVEGFVGITGITCDWKMAESLIRQSEIPVILAGGLSPENVYEGAVSLCPAGVDSCTQTNLLGSDGKPVRFKKDIEKVMRFVSETRKAEKR